MADFMVAGEKLTKLALEVRVRNILHEAPLGVELGPGDQVFLQDLLRRHPEAASKIGAGVRAIRVTTSKYGTGVSRSCVSMGLHRISVISNA